MAQDVRQWLAEIKQLKQELAETQRDRNAAQDSANQWRQLYNTEAQQRRDEAKRHQEATTTLKTELNRLQTEFLGPKNELVARVAIQREVEQLKTSEELKARLLEVMRERDHIREQVRHITESLEQEKANHLQTRNSLTTALGDTVDLLTKAKHKSDSGDKRLSFPMEDLPIESLPPDSTSPALPENPQDNLARLPGTSQIPLPQLLPPQGDE